MIKRSKSSTRPSMRLTLYPAPGAYIDIYTAIENKLDVEIPAG
ncbi:hypothetical protein CUJ84_pRLN3000123 (plasmid) [Rhizobium leguminosarum]|uniref:Uncharacterized protein n=1 Tax=Rhizobium leguminosarum TaxID=384 RepID=A0A2K9ZGU6_RHILE|nr:hypothetical protein CUJ84_pRLN3000123 [Rhizobium leguminosarum]